MNRWLSIAARAALLWCSGASAGWAVSTEEERVLGCGCEDARLREYLPFTRRYSASGVVRDSPAEAAIEGIVAVSAVLVSLLVENDTTSYSIGLLAVPVAILVGGAMGFLNGFLHVKLKTPSFMTTLGVGFAGIAILLGKGREQIHLLVTVDPSLTKAFQAGRIVQELSGILGGKGGGRAEMARGVGKDQTKLDLAKHRALELTAGI